MGRYLNTTSPFSSPPSSQGSINKTSPSRTQSRLFSLPGILQMRTLPSMQRTFMRLPPTRCWQIPRTWLPRGTGVRLRISLSSIGVALFFLGLPRGFFFI